LRDVAIHAAPSIITDCSPGLCAKAARTASAAWRDLPERYGPRTTCYNRFVRWRKAGVWDRMMDAITAAHDGDIQMIGSTSIRAQQQAATANVWLAPSASGLCLTI
jgi:transposase